MPTNLTTLFTFVTLLFLISCKQNYQPTEIQLPNVQLGQALIDSFYDRVRFAYEISDIATNRSINPQLQRTATQLSVANTELYRQLTSLAISETLPLDFEMPKQFRKALIQLNTCPIADVEKTYLELMKQQETWVNHYLANLAADPDLNQKVKMYLADQHLINDEDQLLLSINQ